MFANQRVCQIGMNPDHSVLIWFVFLTFMGWVWFKFCTFFFALSLLILSKMWVLVPFWVVSMLISCAHWMYVPTVQPRVSKDAWCHPGHAVYEPRFPPAARHVVDSYSVQLQRSSAGPATVLVISCSGWHRQETDVLLQWQWVWCVSVTTHIHTLRFNGHFSRWTWVSRLPP